MTRNQTIELILRQIYNGQPSDDSSITFSQVNLWLNQAIGIAAKKNYTDSIQLDGIAYMNNSFYVSYVGLVITQFDNNTFQLSLPHIPFALGKNEGVSTVQFKKDNMLSFTAIPMSINQIAYQDTLRPIQNKVLYWQENTKVYIKTDIPMTQYTASVRMISGGDSTDLSSTLNIPDDYMPIVIEYIKQQLAFERSRPIDTANDGVDNNN